MNKRSGSFKFIPSYNDRERFTFVDLCAGIGGMRIAFESLGGQCIFSSEWDKFCQQTYCENFGEIPYGDITKIPANNIPKHDVLLAGFPCQPFSKGGLATRRRLNKKNGFSDEVQGNIFFHIAEIISKKKPQAIFLENVPKLEHLNEGRILKTMLDYLKKIGYDANYKIISSETVVPQRRQRMYIVGFRKKTVFKFPNMPILNPELKNILEKDADSKYTLSNDLWLWLQNHAKKHAKKGNGFGFRLADPKKTACTLSARYGKDGSEILIPQRRRNPRKLTPRECARLMGFPDEFRIPVSDTQAYKQFGNSIVVPVAYVIGYEMLKHIDCVKKGPGTFQQAKLEIPHVMRLSRRT